MEEGMPVILHCIALKKSLYFEPTCPSHYLELIAPLFPLELKL